MIFSLHLWTSTQNLATSTLLCGHVCSRFLSSIAFLILQPRQSSCLLSPYGIKEEQQICLCLSHMRFHQGFTSVVNDPETAPTVTASLLSP